MSDDQTSLDPHQEAIDAKRLKSRIAAVLARTPQVSVQREDGTVLLRGRRSRDRNAKASDRRTIDRRQP